MTTNDFDRTARLWLEDGPTQLSDRALYGRPRRDPRHPTAPCLVAGAKIYKMNTPSNSPRGRPSLAIVVVVALAVDGFNLLPGSGIVGGSSSPPLPTATTAPGSTASPGFERGHADFRRYRRTSGTRLLRRGRPVPAASQLHGAGWLGGQHRGPEPRGPGSERRVQARCPSRSSTRCTPTHVALRQGLPRSAAGHVGRRSGDGVGAPARAHRHDTDRRDHGWPSGRAAHPDRPRPAPPAARLASPGSGSSPLGAINELTPGEVDKVWILDVGGQRLVIDAPETPGQTTTTAQVQGILDSIGIGAGARGGPWPVTAQGGSVVGDAASPLAPGTYVAAAPFLLRVTFTVPAGWEGNIGGPFAVFLGAGHGSGRGVPLDLRQGVRRPAGTGPKVSSIRWPASSVDDLGTALARSPGSPPRARPPSPWVATRVSSSR